MKSKRSSHHGKSSSSPPPPPSSSGIGLHHRNTNKSPQLESEATVTTSISPPPSSFSFLKKKQNDLINPNSGNGGNGIVGGVTGVGSSSTIPIHYKQYDKKVKVQYHSTNRRRRFGFGNFTGSGGNSNSVHGGSCFSLGLGRAGRGIYLILMRISNSRSIFSYLKFGAGLFLIVYTVTFWHLGTIARNHYYYHHHDMSSSSVGRLNSFKSETGFKHTYRSSTKDQMMSLQQSKQEYYSDHDASVPSYGSGPDNTEFSRDYIEWNRKQRESFENIWIERQRERKRRTSTRSPVLDKYVTESGLSDTVKEDEVMNYFKRYNFEFLSSRGNSDIHHNNYGGKEDSENKMNEKRDSPCGLSAQTASTKYPFLYPDIHSINEKSVVLITGILSRTGFHLALKLATECNVQTIIGLDPMIPNNVPNRIKIIDQLSKLYNSTPKLQQNLIIPYSGFSPKEGYKSRFEKFTSEETGELDFSLLELTHVVHLLSIDDYSNSALEGSDSPYIMTSNQGGEEQVGNHMFGLRQSLVGIDHLLSTLTSGRKDSPVHFTFVSDIDLQPPHGWRDMENDIRSTSKLMEEVLLQMHFRESRSDAFVTLRLPFIYGPWGKSGSVDYDLAEVAVKNWNDKRLLESDSNENIVLTLDSQKKFDMKERDILFVDDAVDAIMTAMQYRKQNSFPASFNVASGEKASASTLAEMIQNFMKGGAQAATLKNNLPSFNGDFNPASEYLHFEPKISLVNGTAELLAWHLNINLPNGERLSPLENYDSSESKLQPSDNIMQNSSSNNSIHATMTGYQLLDRENMLPHCEDQTYCLRGYRVLPCASECADLSMCRATGFDEAAIKSRDLTKNCKNVLYTSLFGRDVDSLHITAPDMNEKGFCKIAFVSKNSKLVREHSMKKLHNGWTIIEVDLEGEKVQPEDKWLPKLSPSKLFHPRVRYAVHLNDDLPMSPSMDDMLFIIELTKWEKRDALDVVKESKESMILLSALDLNMKNANSNNPSDKDTTVPEPETNTGAKSSILTIPEAKDKILEYRGIVLQKDRQALQRRISFSQQAMLLLNRPEFSTTYQTTLKYKLRHWVKTKWVVHDLHKSGGRDLRCDWYKEHTKLDDDFDEFSFASIMAKKELEHFLSLEGITEDDFDGDNQDTQFQMIERNDQVQEWISVADQTKSVEYKEYVRIVDAKSLINGRQEWNRKRNQEAQLMKQYQEHLKNNKAKSS